MEDGTPLKGWLGLAAMGLRFKNGVPWRTGGPNVERRSHLKKSVAGLQPTRQVPRVVLFFFSGFVRVHRRSWSAATYIAKDVAGGCTGAGTGDAAASERRFRCRLEE